MRTPQEAVTWASGPHQYPVGSCLQFVTDAYGVKGPYNDAATAWAHTEFRGAGHPGLGMPMWWTGGSHGFGHVTISDGGTGCYSTDFADAGYVGDGKVRHLTDASNISRHDPALTYVGWSEDLEGVNVAQFTDAQAQALLEILSALSHYGTTYGSNDADRVFGFVKAAAGHIQAAPVTATGAHAHSHPFTGTTGVSQ